MKTILLVLVLCVGSMSFANPGKYETKAPAKKAAAKKAPAKKASAKKAAPKTSKKMKASRLAASESTKPAYTKKACATEKECEQACAQPAAIHKDSDGHWTVSCKN